MTGTDGPTFMRDRPGIRAFVREDDAGACEALP
jgi:hypothetical protein